MKLADALVATLRDWDLKYLFGVGGANIEHVYDAAHRLGEGRFQVICAKTETGAAFMADCRARSLRTLGLCCATSGGGMMNLAVGVAESFAESIPVLAIIGQPPTRLHGRGAFQDSSGIGRTVNADVLWSAITKYRATIAHPADFWPCLEKAVRTALSSRPGPCALLIPRDLYDCEVGDRPAWLPAGIEEFSTPADVCSRRLGDLLAAIRAARSPVLLVGSGVFRCSRPTAVGEFARRMGIPVATTLASKHCFPGDDPLFLGMVGAAGEPSAHHYLKRQADLIVAVGTDLNVMTTQPIHEALSPPRLAAVNSDLSELRRIVSPAVEVEADEGLVFSRLIHLCDELRLIARRPETMASLRYAPRLAPRLPPEEPSIEGPPPAPPAGDDSRDTAGESLLQSEALQVLQQFLPERGNVIFDAGNCAAAALHYLNIPRQTNAAIALGMGGMGYSIPAAIGAQLGADSGSRTMVVCGDGAFLMLGAEVNTAVQYRLPILFVVFNNNMHGMCVTRQQLYFEGRIEGARYPAVSIADFARGLGPPDRLWTGAAGTIDQLKQKLDEFHSAADRPGVLELRLAREEIPPFAPFLPADAPTYLSSPAAALPIAGDLWTTAPTKACA